jgi:DHA1 family bicyclomycin/chloramphenicol resistance-like MFS transporter
VLGPAVGSLKLLQQPPFRADTAPSIALLATIAMMGTMAMHMVIPVMPAMAADLQASPGTIQMTVTLYLFGLAIGQLIYGPLSDRFGRRPILLGGLTLYVLSGLVVATTANAGLLLPARIFQALGGCSGLVLGRAMMRDGASEDKAARSLAVLNTALSLGPALAPAVGGFLGAWAGWRAPFVLLVAVGALMLLLAVLTLPETNRKRTDLPGIRAMAGSYVTLLRLPTYRGLCADGLLRIHQHVRVLRRVAVHLHGPAASDGAAGRCVLPVRRARYLGRQL